MTIPQANDTWRDDAGVDWWDSMDWPADPCLAFARGIAVGVEIGRAQVDGEIVAAIAWSLSGGRTTDYRAAVRVHERLVDQRTARIESDVAGRSGAAA